MANKDGFLALLESWVAQELVALYRHPEPVAKGLLIGASAWGHYVERFLTFTARSMDAPRNSAALRHNSRTLLFTDGPGFAPLRDYAKARQADGFPTQIVVIPDMILQAAKADKDFKFYLLGATHNLQVQYAARYGMGYHMSMPDCIYADGYFPGLLYLAKHYKAIAHTNPSAHVSILDELPKTGPLSFTPEQLGALTWRHLHDQSRSNLMNHGHVVDGYPPSFFHIWQARDALIINSPHLSATYMSPDLCAKAPIRSMSPIDCQLPFLMGSGFYTPKREHGLVYVEVSDNGKTALHERKDSEVFAAICWHSVQFRSEYLPFYSASSVFPIPVQQEYLTDADIAQRHANIIKDICALKDEVEGRIAFREVA